MLSSSENSNHFRQKPIKSEENSQQESCPCVVKQDTSLYRKFVTFRDDTITIRTLILYSNRIYLKASMVIYTKRRRFVSLHKHKSKVSFCHHAHSFHKAKLCFYIICKFAPILVTTARIGILCILDSGIGQKCVV